MSLLVVIAAVLLGCALAYRFGRLTGAGPLWAQVLLVVGAGVGLGIGFTAVLFFLARAFVPVPLLAPLIEVAAGAWLAWEVFRMPKPAATPGRVNWMIVGGLVAVLGLAVGAFAHAWENNPQGAWDAFSIWNLRAKMLASPESLASRAWSPLLKHTHPDYPLLLSSFVARGWAYSGSLGESMVPIATSLLFFIGLLALGIGILSIERSPSIGLAFGLVLAASPSLLHEVPAQYADVPIAYYFAAAVAMALLNRPLLAGVFAGLAAFTKNEGFVFVAVLVLAMTAAKKGPELILAAAAPFVALSAFVKYVLAAGAQTVETGNANTTEIGAIVSGFMNEFVNLGAGLYHPLLPVAALALIWGMDARYRRSAFTALAVALAMMASYFFVILFTPNDVTWQIGTALARLYAQIWPTALLGCMLLLRSPDRLEPASEQVRTSPLRKPRKRGGGPISNEIAPSAGA
jgi:hypothetical protein